MLSPGHLRSVAARLEVYRRRRRHANRLVIVDRHIDIIERDRRSAADWGRLGLNSLVLFGNNERAHLSICFCDFKLDSRPFGF